MTLARPLLGDLWSSLCVLRFSLQPRPVVIELSPPLLRLVGADEQNSLAGMPLRDLFAEGSGVDPLISSSAPLSDLEGREVELRSIDGRCVVVEVLAAIEEAEETGRALLVLHPPLEDDSLEVVRRERFENRRLRHLVEHSADIVFRVDAVGGLRYVSPAAADLLGWSVEELLNRRYVDLVPATSRFEVRRFYFQQLRDRVASTYLEVPVSTSGGNEVWVGQNVQLVIEAGQVVGFEGIAREITDRRRREQQLAHRATHDSLTRLYNRSFFEGQLEKSLAESVRYGTSGAVLVIDLDGFKDVNDRFGHKVGDTYLAGFGELLRRRFRESDVVARIGGDEFAVLLQGPRPDSFEEVAGGLLAMIRLYAATGDERASTTASIGVALYPDHGTSCEHVLAHADLSMYRAKELGRNRFAVFASEESGGAASEEVSAQLLNRVRGALDRRDFELFAQPVYSVNDGTLFFHEILLRLRAADGQILPAASFLDLAERFGSIRDIDFWVVEHAWVQGVVATLPW